jgi:hypothetical protein
MAEILIKGKPDSEKAFLWGDCKNSVPKIISTGFLS